MGDEGARAIAQCLRRNGRLRILDLRDNQARSTHHHRVVAACVTCHGAATDRDGGAPRALSCCAGERQHTAHPSAMPQFYQALRAVLWLRWYEGAPAHTTADLAQVSQDYVVMLGDLKPWEEKRETEQSRQAVQSMERHTRMNYARCDDGCPSPVRPPP